MIRKYRRRLCLNCLSDWTRSSDLTEELCPACRIEHEMRWEANLRSNRGEPTAPSQPSDWWGFTEREVDPDDLRTGFYVASADGSPDAPMHPLHHD